MCVRESVFACLCVICIHDHVHYSACFRARVFVCLCLCVRVRVRVRVRMRGAYVIARVLIFMCTRYVVYGCMSVYMHERVNMSVLICLRT